MFYSASDVWQNDRAAYIDTYDPPESLTTIQIVSQLHAHIVTYTTLLHMNLEGKN